MRWSRVALLACVVVAVSGQGHGTGSDDLSNVYPSYPGQEDPDIAYPSPSPKSGEPDPADINWNETIDYLLALATSKGLDEVPLPNITREFTHRIGFLKLKGEFTASQGFLKGLSSVRRAGDVIVLKRGTVFSMTCAVKLQDVRLRYEHYRAKIRRGPSFSGSIEVEIGSSSVEVRASIDVTNTTCATTLDEVKVREVSGLKVELRGSAGPLIDGLRSMITTWLVNMFKGNMVTNLEKGLTRELTRGLAKSRCEKYASYFIFVEPK